MTHDSKHRRFRLTAGAAVLLMLLTGCGPAGSQQDPGAESPTTTPATSQPTGPWAGSDGTAADLAMDESRPVSLRIEELERESRIIETGLREDQTLEVPPEHEGAPASWYNGSPTPGESGTAVLLGHVNSSQDDSGVFYNLEALEQGDSIAITREDGSTAVFDVYKIELYPKDEFPTRAVYSPTNGAELRLITCDGFAESTGEFVKNLVVYAKLTNMT